MPSRLKVIGPVLVLLAVWTVSALAVVAVSAVSASSGATPSTLDLFGFVWGGAQLALVVFTVWRSPQLRSRLAIATAAFAVCALPVNWLVVAVTLTQVSGRGVILPY